MSFTEFTLTVRTHAHPDGDTYYLFTIRIPRASDDAPSLVWKIYRFVCVCVCVYNTCTLFFDDKKRKSMARENAHGGAANRSCSF